MKPILPVLILLGFGSTGLAQSPDPTIPTALPLSRYTGQWEKSAFHRVVIPQKQVEIAGPSFATSMILEGVVRDNKLGPIAYLKKREDNQLLVVTSKRNEKGKHPYYLVSADIQNDPSQTSIKISNGKDTATMSYDPGTLSRPVATAPSARPVPGGLSPENRNALQRAAAEAQRKGTFHQNPTGLPVRANSNSTNPGAAMTTNIIPNDGTQPQPIQPDPPPEEFDPNQRIDERRTVPPPRPRPTQ